MKRQTIVLIAVVLALLVTLVFSTPGFSQPPEPSGVEQLRQDAGGKVEITWNPQTGTPSFIRGRIPLSVMRLQSEADPSTAAFAFMDRYAGLFGLKQASHELNVVQTDVDTLGMKHVTLGQVYQGVEVYGALMKLHLSADGQEIVVISSGFVPDIQLPDVQPRIGADQALVVAQKALLNGTLISGPNLAVYPGVGEDHPGAFAKLAWLVELRDDSIPTRNVYVVDAVEGTIIDILDRLYEEIVGSTMEALQGAVQQQPVYNSTFLSDAQLEDYNSMSAEQIRAFLASYSSYFHQPIQDVDGQTFDPPAVIAQASSQNRINPKVILTTLQKESSGVTNSTRPSDSQMRSLMGCSWGVTARDQLRCAAERFRAYHDQLTNTGSTVSGWQVGVPKLTQDGVTVTPATKAVAGQFTYTPYVGEQWGGDQPSVGGVYLFYTAWNQFGFNGCLVGQYYAEYYNNRILSGDPNFGQCEDAPIGYDWGTEGPDNGVGNDNFSVRWTGRFNFADDTYHFVARTDDGIRVWVDDALIIDAWWDQSPTTYFGDYELTAGTYEVRVEYYEHGGGSVAHLRWWGSTSDPDDGRVISSNETLWGTIEPADDVDTYYFDATQGQQATIWMPKSNFTPSLDSYLILYAPDGSELARDDNNGGDQNALIDRVSLTQTGRYRIEASSYAGGSTGLYSLNLRLQQPGQPNRETYDANHSYSLPGTLVRSEGDGPTGDQDVDNAHDFAGTTYDYYFNTHGRDSYDDRGATLVSTANYGNNYLNAFWNGEQTAYGDDFPVKDIVAHEWTHAVTEHSANLEYRWQFGALNESFSDIFGAMVDRDDWLMGEELPPRILGGRKAIRDLSDPPRFSQPDHTDDWVETCSDNEGVHTNSGIPNKAYYNIATAIDGDKAELIFYRILTVYLQPTSSLEDTRAAALQSAQDLYGDGSAEYNAVQDGFNAVGLDGVWNPPPNDCVCGATVALTAEPDGQSLLSNLRAVRDQVFAQDPGRRWASIYYKHQFEVARLLITDGELRADAQAGFRAFDPVFRALLNGDEADPPVILTRELIEAAERALMGVAERGSPEVREDIVREWEKVNPYRFVGWDVREVWEQLRLEEQSEQIYLPIIVK